MTFKYVIGMGAALDVMVTAWSHVLPNARVVRIEICQGSDYQLDWSALNKLHAGDDVFVACDERFGNFTRLEIFQAVIERGLQMPAFVSSHAKLGAGAKLGPNCCICDGAIVGAHSVIGYNCVVNAGANLGVGSRIKSSCWIDAGVQLGAGVELGAHSTLRPGVLVASGVKIGRNSEIGVPGHYQADIASRTVIDPRYDSPIYVYGT